MQRFTASEQNLRLLQAIEANRAFLLLAYASNPGLLACAEPRIRQLFEALPEPAVEWPVGRDHAAGR